MWLVDTEVAQRALRLRAPVLVARDLKLAKGVALGAHRRHLVGGGMKGSGDGAVCRYRSEKG